MYVLHFEQVFAEVISGESRGLVVRDLMREGPQLTETLAHLVWGDFVQPPWSGLNSPEVCARSFSLYRYHVDSLAEGRGSAVCGISQGCSGPQ